MHLTGIWTISGQLLVVTYHLMYNFDIRALRLSIISMSHISGEAAHGVLEVLEDMFLGHL